jgi:hypothetical protein
MWVRTYEVVGFTSLKDLGIDSWGGGQLLSIYIIIYYYLYVTTILPYYRDLILFCTMLNFTPIKPAKYIFLVY